MGFLEKQDLPESYRAPKAQLAKRLEDPAGGRASSEFPHPQVACGRVQTGAVGTRKTGDTSLVQKTPEFSSGGMGREASFCLCSLADFKRKEGRKDKGVWWWGVPKAWASHPGVEG